MYVFTFTGQVYQHKIPLILVTWIYFCFEVKCSVKLNQLSLSQQDDCKTRMDIGNVQQNIQQLRLPQREQQSTTNQQKQNHRLRIDSSLSQQGLNCILLAQNIRPRFCYSTHYDETKKRAHDSQIAKAKQNLKLSHGGSAKDKYQASTNR